MALGLGLGLRMGLRPGVAGGLPAPTNLDAGYADGEFWYSFDDLPEEYILDADASTQIARITADGGQVEDETFLSDFIADLKAGGAAGDCYALLDALWIPVASKIDGARKVSKLYDLAPAKTGSVYYDAIQSTAINQQTLTSAAGGLDGKAVLQFTSTLGAYTSGAMATTSGAKTVFAVCRKDGGGTTIRSIIDVTTGRLNLFYNANTTSIRAFHGGPTLEAATNQATWGRFTVLMNGVGSYIRRGGSTLVTADAGAVSVGGTYKIGSTNVTSSIHNGPMAALGVVKQTITTVQRDHIESVLATHFPSAV